MWLETGAAWKDTTNPYPRKKRGCQPPAEGKMSGNKKKKSFGGRHEHGMALLPSLTAQLLNPPLSCLRRFFSFFLFAAR